MKIIRLKLNAILLILLAAFPPSGYSLRPLATPMSEVLGELRSEVRGTASTPMFGYEGIQDSILQELVRQKELLIQQLLVRNYFNLMRRELKISKLLDEEQFEVAEQALHLGFQSQFDRTGIPALKEPNAFLRIFHGIMSIPLSDPVEAAKFYKIKSLLNYSKVSNAGRLTDMLDIIQFSSLAVTPDSSAPHHKSLEVLRSIFDFKLLFSVDINQKDVPLIKLFITELRQRHFEKFIEAQFSFQKSHHMKRTIWPLIPLLDKTLLNSIAAGRSVELESLPYATVRTHLRRIIFYLGEPGTVYHWAQLNENSPAYLFPTDPKSGPLWVEEDGTLGINVSVLKSNRDGIMDILVGALKLPVRSLHKFFVSPVRELPIDKPDTESRSELRLTPTVSGDVIPFPAFPPLDFRQALKTILPPFGLGPNLDAVLIDAALMPLEAEDPEEKQKMATAWTTFLVAFEAAKKPFVIVGQKITPEYQQAIVDLNGRLIAAGKAPVAFARDIPEAQQILRQQMKKFPLRGGRTRPSEWNFHAILSPSFGIEAALLKRQIGDNYTFMAFDQFVRTTARIVDGLGLSSYAQKLATEFFTRTALTRSA